MFMESKLCRLICFRLARKIEEYAHWVISLDTAEKKNADLRLCIDPKKCEQIDKERVFPFAN